MRRGGALYSSSRSQRPVPRGSAAGDAREEIREHPVAQRSSPAPRGAAAATWRAFYGRHERVLTIGISALIAVLAIIGYTSFNPAPRALSQEDIDAAVL